MKYASIDIGTNTVLLMIGNVKERVEEVSDRAIITRLGEGLKETGLLSSDAMERTFSALSSYKTIAGECRVDEILCVGTAALREAKNSDVFLKRVREELAIDVRVISTRDEAYYTYLSARESLQGNAGDVVIVDIGGGSTEIIYGDKENLLQFISLPVGSVKLTEMFIRNDPPSEGEIEDLRESVRSMLASSFRKGTDSLVGTAGTVTTLGSLSISLDEWDKRKIHGLTLSREDIGEVVRRLCALNISERRVLAGMEKGREDIVLQGIVLLQEIMEYLGAKELLIDANGVRHGVLVEKSASYRRAHLSCVE